VRQLHLRSALNYKSPEKFERPLSSDFLRQLPDLEVLDLSYNSMNSWQEEPFLENREK
jgi:hypothetical protein